MKRLHRPQTYWLGLLLLLWLLPGHNQSYVMYVAGLAGINIILAVSLNIVSGTTGQFSLGHAAFMAVGGYSAASLSVFVTSKVQPSFLPAAWADPVIFLFTVLLGGAVAALAGFLVGLPSLRLRGDYLAIVTLGFGEIVRVLLENFEAVGGGAGLIGIPPHSTLPWIATWVVITVLFAKRLQESPLGGAMKAVREDEIAAESLGVDTTRTKVAAFVLSSFFAGVAGALLGHYLQILAPRDFTFVRSIEVVVMVVLGGLGSVSGSVLAAILLTALPEALRPLQDWTGVDFRMVIYSLLLITMMVLRPTGFFGSSEIWEVFRQRRKREAAPPLAGASDGGAP